MGRTFSGDAENAQITRYSLRGDSKRSFGHAIRLEALIPLSAWHCSKNAGFADLGHRVKGGKSGG